MDEILIEEKRYISSKQAAKATGYAKDYIGQLCREGRVPARLVGRNWYVLEAAIHDHRFGPQAEASMHDAEAPESRQEFESPRYEALSADEFPQITHQRQDGSEPASIRDEQGEPSRHLQDSWKEWFERIAVADTAAASPIPEVSAAGKSPESIEAEEEKKEEAVAGEREGDGKEEEKEIRIPIRAIHHSRYQAPPEELLPRRHAEYEQTRVAVAVINDNGTEQAIPAKKTWKNSTIMTIRAISTSIALLTVVLAVIGSGYLDTYIISYSRVSIITGIVTYNR